MSSPGICARCGWVTDDAARIEALERELAEARTELGLARSYEHEAAARCKELAGDFGRLLRIYEDEAGVADVAERPAWLQAAVQNMRDALASEGDDKP